MIAIEQGQTIHGFHVEGARDIPEIGGTAYSMRHEASGAQLLHLAVRDEEKGFAIGFRTHPADSTGVFHILEHSVLNGSGKYPVKDPFVHLLKSSMNTFLNAMTGSDFTMYPVASTNEKDLMNLMSIYLDAVFDPAILREPRILKQEGWHYEYENGQLTVNGVVYNEMEGSLANPGTRLHHAVNGELFPNTAYRFISGGEPGVIETLTYQQFVDTYRRHYRPDNAAIVLYGEMDLDGILAYIDREYLAGWQDKHGEPVGAPNPMGSQEPVVSTERKVHMKALPQDARVAYASVFADADDSARLSAMQILGDALLGSNEAPLKRRLLEAGFADDFGGAVGQAAKGYFSVSARNIKPDSAQLFLDTLRASVREILDEGLDRKELETALFSAEFHLRTGGPMGKPTAAPLMQACLGWWASGGGLDGRALQYESDLEFVRAALDTDYYEKLAEEVFLTSDHYALVELCPSEEDASDERARKLQQQAEQMGEAELERIQQEAAELKRWQEEPETPEALATLPRLQREDCAVAPDYAGYWMEEAAGMPVLRHDCADAGIAHILRAYNLADLTMEEYQHVNVMAAMVSQNATKKHSAKEVVQLKDGRLGSLFAGMSTDAPGKDGSLRAYLWVYSCSLASDIEFTSEYVDEVLHETLFNDRDRLREAVDQLFLMRKQMLFEYAPHNAASGRARAHFMPGAVLSDAASGVAGYLFAKQLKERCEDDAEADKVLHYLQVLLARVLGRRPQLVSFAGDDETLQRFAKAEMARVDAYEQQAAQFLDGLPAEDRAFAGAPVIADTKPLPAEDEAFIIPGNSAYCSQALDLSGTPERSSGCWSVVGKAASLDFLWNEVRAKGGAYGVNFSEGISGAAVFTSFRDPRVDGTLENFEQLGEWLAGFNPSDEEMDGFAISCTAGFDRPTKALVRVLSQCTTYLRGWSLDDRARQRREVVACQAEDVRRLGSQLAGYQGPRHTVVLASRELIEGSGREFKVVDLT